MSSHRNIDPARLALSPAQCRAARGLLGWSQDELAERARTTQRTVSAFEVGETVPKAATVGKLKTVLEAAGIEFVARPGTIGALLHRPVE